MPTFTIDLPDNLNIPSNWDIRTFVIQKIHEEGMFPSDQAGQGEDDTVDPDPDSWFTLEQRKQFRENRRRLEEEVTKNPPRMTHEEYYQLLMNGPVATEEEIQVLEEIQEMRRQWKSPWL